MSDNAHFNDSQHWRDRAEQARILAEQMNDDLTKQMMFRIAEDYENLASRAASHIGGGTKAG